MAYIRGISDDALLKTVCDLVRKDYGEELGLTSAANVDKAESVGPNTFGQTNSVDDSLSAEASDAVKKIKCINVGCRSRGPMTCVHRMCFFCCFSKCKQEDIVCEAHAKQAKQREEENRLIEQTLLAPKARRLYHFKEERITGVGQTVVLFCLRDFLRNPRWSRDTIDLELRRERQKRSLQRRERLRRSDNLAKSQSSSQPPGSIDNMHTEGNGSSAVKLWRYRQKAALRYQKVLDNWAKRLKSN